MTSTFEIQNFKKIDRRKQKLLNSKHWRGQMKFVNNAGYQSTVGSLLNPAMVSFSSRDFCFSRFCSLDHAPISKCLVISLNSRETLGETRSCKFLQKKTKSHEICMNMILKY